jgi:hypothetical protein
VGQLTALKGQESIMLVSIVLAVLKGLMYVAVEIGLAAVLVLTVRCFCALVSCLRRRKQEPVPTEATPGESNLGAVVTDLVPA